MNFYVLKITPVATDSYSKFIYFDHIPTLSEATEIVSKINDPNTNFNWVQEILGVCHPNTFCKITSERSLTVMIKVAGIQVGSIGFTKETIQNV